MNTTYVALALCGCLLFGILLIDWRLFITSLICLVLLFALSGCVDFERTWRTENRIDEWAFQSLHTIDALQTAQIQNHPTLHETDPLLGAHPSHGKIAVWDMTVAYGHALTTDYLDEHSPIWVQRVWQYTTIGLTSYYVVHNYQIGIRLGF